MNDSDTTWTVYTSSCTFSGMPMNQHPSNFKLYFRPYAGTVKASDNPANGVGSIGHTSISGVYKSNYEWTL